MAVRQLRYCTHCGMPLMAPANYCRGCGSPLRMQPADHQAPHLVPVPGTAAATVPGALPAPRPAPAKRRVAAGLVDLFLAGCASLSAWALAAEASVILAGGGAAARHPGRGLLAWGVAAVVLGGYQPFFWSRWGRTPGMGLLGLRVALTATR